MATLSKQNMFKFHQKASSESAARDPPTRSCGHGCTARTPQSSGPLGFGRIGLRCGAAPRQPSGPFPAAFASRGFVRPPALAPVRTATVRSRKFALAGSPRRPVGACGARSPLPPACAAPAASGGSRPQTKAASCARPFRAMPRNAPLLRTADPPPPQPRLPEPVPGTAFAAGPPGAPVRGKFRKIFPEFRKSGRRLRTYLCSVKKDFA